MVLESNRDLVLRRLVECLGRDRTRHQVAEVTSLGLVQMTRKRIGTGLLEAFSTDCEHCKGRGLVLHDHPVESGGGHEDDEPRGRRNRGGRNRGGRGGSAATATAATERQRRRSGGQAVARRPGHSRPPEKPAEPTPATEPQDEPRPSRDPAEPPARGAAREVRHRQAGQHRARAAAGPHRVGRRAVGRCRRPSRNPTRRAPTAAPRPPAPGHQHPPSYGAAPGRPHPPPVGATAPTGPAGAEAGWTAADAVGRARRRPRRARSPRSQHPWPSRTRAPRRRPPPRSTATRPGPTSPNGLTDADESDQSDAGDRRTTGTPAASR